MIDVEGDFEKALEQFERAVPLRSRLDSERQTYEDARENVQRAFYAGIGYVGVVLAQLVREDLT